MVGKYDGNEVGERVGMLDFVGEEVEGEGLGTEDGIAVGEYVSKMGMSSSWNLTLAASPHVGVLVRRRNRMDCIDMIPLQEVAVSVK